MREKLLSATRDFMVLGGAVLVAHGCWLAWKPLGFIVGGLFLGAVGVAGELRKPQEREGE